VYEQANFWGCVGFLPKLPQTCSKNKQKHDLQFAKRLQFDFESHFHKIKAHTAILRRFSHIAQISTDFARISPNQVLGCACTPASYTSGPKALLHCTFLWKYGMGVDVN